MAALLGALVPLGFAPFSSILPVLLAWSGFLVLIDDAALRPHAGREAAWLGWGFGFGQFVTGLSWIGAAFLVEAEVFGWIMPFAIAGLCAGLAVFFAGAAFVAAKLWRGDGTSPIILASAVTLSEALRGHVLTGFPWNQPGQVLAAHDTALQIIAVIGPNGGNFLAVALASAPAFLLLGRKGLAPVLAALVVVCGVWGFGAARLAQASSDVVPGVRLRLVQPDIPQTQKWEPAFQRYVFDRLLQLSKAPADGVRPTHIVWPEAATPFILDRTPQALGAIADMLGPGRVLVTGALRVDLDDDGHVARAYNSVQVFNDQTRLMATYDKAHLVPFGEYLPLRALIAGMGLRAIAAHFGGCDAWTRATIDRGAGSAGFCAGDLL